MAEHQRSVSVTKPTPIPSPRGSFEPSASSPHSNTRVSSTARLASPVRSNGVDSPQIRQIPTLEGEDPARSPPLAGIGGTPPHSGPGQSALAAAFQESRDSGTSRPAPSPPIRPLSPGDAEHRVQRDGTQITYGSFDLRTGNGNGSRNIHTLENPEVVRRHLVQPSEASSNKPDTLDRTRSIRNSSTSARRHSRTSRGRNESQAGAGADEDEFSSLQLQGGDVTREVYRWTEDAEAQFRGLGRGQRSQSFHVPRPPPESEVLNINSIKAPGGFRRNYLRRAADSPSPPTRYGNSRAGGDYHARRPNRPPQLLTNNFIEFLSIYGHFAGEELEEDDEVLQPDEYFSSDFWDESHQQDSDDDREPGEDSTLLTPGTLGKRRRRRKERTTGGTNSASGAVLLLLKAFVGTGVLFLPKAFLNGGMLFSNLVLLGVALLSYYCFILLVDTRFKVDASFGDIGGIIYGKFMRGIILFSIVISQIGFASAYIVFTAENLQAFVLAVSKCRTFIDIKLIILMQLVLFLPLSLIRDISKLGATALVADVLILLGLIYLYYYDIYTLVSNHGVADIAQFNPNDWTLFIGTAIFTFEGIGLVIPIQETMRHPKQFPSVLAGVMILITAVFISMGALSYAAYGSSTRTVVILNLPQDNKFVNTIQFFYSFAILLSTPLQLFPAIRITENELFSRSGKYNPYIKWQKNLFRFLLVMLCALIAWGGASDLDKFVALVGSIACVPLVYVYPPLLHLKVVARTSFQRVADVSLCILGVVVMVYTTSLTIKSWADKKAVNTPGYCHKP